MLYLLLVYVLTLTFVRWATCVDMEDSNNPAAHLLALELMRWQRRNKVSEQGMNELFTILRPFIAENAQDYFPRNCKDAHSTIREIMSILDIHTVEICSEGCHRFPERTSDETCPTCGTPRKSAEDGQLTTCTFTFFELKQKLRILFGRPNFVPLLTSYGSHQPNHETMRGVHGAF